ncbi:GNAT family N-acetyltransferase [Acidipropionibacterium virtanenii]|uniref:GNAT family N-acetyltransferase n=1 Tax=Acidipropionibacterium virtanenii TaxID=2057246 RepID=UPI001C68ECE0|nr:GNAT family N-acetyltransferase [Acidipropionibacterium virtanenii]
MTWPSAEPLTTGDLRLDPLRVADAGEMAGVLADESLYRFTGGSAPAPSRLRARYRSQVRGASSDGTQGWLNWIVRPEPPGAAVGFVQATLERRSRTFEDLLVASLGWVVGPVWQGRGIATRATGAVLEWLVSRGVAEFRAHIHPDNAASQKVAAKLGFRPTGLVLDGEIRWVLEVSGSG